MKALWCSNHPESASGYGSQTRQVGRRLLAAGHDVVFQCNWGQAGMITRWEGALVLGLLKNILFITTIAQQPAAAGRRHLLMHPVSGAEVLPAIDRGSAGEWIEVVGKPLP